MLMPRDHVICEVFLRKLVSGLCLEYMSIFNKTYTLIELVFNAM